MGIDKWRPRLQIYNQELVRVGVLHCTLLLIDGRLKHGFLGSDFLFSVSRRNDLILDHINFDHDNRSLSFERKVIQDN
jgi:hypothetical protein